MISSCTIMGVPRMTVTYTLQMPLNRPRMGFLCPVRCWSWAVRITATRMPRRMPRVSARAVTSRVVPTPFKYCFHRLPSINAW